MKIYLAVFALVVAIVGCNGGGTDGVKNATGETPVKYVICAPGEKSCFVVARFKDLDSCQSHKEWSEMLCDKVTTPGKMACTANPSSVASAYCTL
jgi:hypothetical protein